jgi:hypothetical protein
MATVTIDLNDVVGVQAAGLRALADALGDDGARVFINQYTNGYERPRMAASQIAGAIERGKARAAALNASVGGGIGDYTAERYQRPERTYAEVSADIKRIQAAKSSAGVMP